MYRYIKAMADTRKAVERELKSCGRQIVVHLTKLMIYPEAQQANHWKQEIYSFLNNVPKLKGSKKYPSKSFIFNAISVYVDTIDSIKWQLQYDESDLTQLDIDDAVIEKKATRYLDWLATELSQKGAVQSVQVYNMLDKII